MDTIYWHMNATQGVQIAHMNTALGIHVNPESACGQTECGIRFQRSDGLVSSDVF